MTSRSSPPSIRTLGQIAERGRGVNIQFFIQFFRRIVIVGLLVAAVVATIAPAALAAPSLTAVPAVGPPGSSTSLSGSGFGASEAVDLFFDTTDLQLVVTDGTGAFSATITVPSTATPGDHQITAEGRRTHLAAQATYTVSTDWPQFHGGARHTGYNSTETLLNTSSIGGLDLSWSRNVALNFLSSATEVNGTLYTESTNGRVYALNPSDGSIIWNINTSGELHATPAVVGGRVFVAGTDGKVYAFDAVTGTQVWVARTQDSFDRSSVSVAGGMAYVASAGNNVLYAFRANCSGTCKPAWTSAPAGDDFEGSPTVANGRVFIGSFDHNVYAYDAKGVTNCSGTPKVCTPLWTATLNDQVLGSVAVVNGAVYAGDYSGDVWALQASTGLTIWQSSAVTALTASPTVANGVVYVGDGFSLYAFDANDGTQLWEAALNSTITSSAEVANGVVYVGAYDFNVYAFAAAGCGAAMCQPLWSYPLPATVESSPAVVNGSLFIGDNDGRLYAFGLPPAGTASRRERRPGA